MYPKKNKIVSKVIHFQVLSLLVLGGMYIKESLRKRVQLPHLLTLNH